MERLMIMIALIALGACTPQKPAISEPVLPAGNPVAGKAAFQELRCWSCHEIYGGDMPKPVAQPPVPVYLGGNAIKPPDDLYLLRAVIAPSHELAPGWGTEATKAGELSRMGDFSQVMTVRQMLDLIAFVKSRYGPAADQAVRQQQTSPSL